MPVAFSPGGGTTCGQRSIVRAAIFVARKPGHVCVWGEDDVGGVIYLMRKNGERLIEMNEHGYDTEDLLQGYLADHPDLLAGD
jgi:hypothetical protein